MNIYQQIEDEIKAIIGRLYAQEGLDVSRVEASPPKDASHGEVATNAAMVLAKKLQVKPQELAVTLLKEIEKLPSVAEGSIAGAGFINLRLEPEVWQNLIPAILDVGTSYGLSTAGGDGKVNIEYVSANPTGPMHVGHGRGAVVGDALAKLMQKAGYKVTKEYYINDGGAQIDKLADSTFLRYREALGEAIGDIPEGLYPGDYLKDVGRAMAAIYGDSLLSQPRAEWLPVVREFSVEANMAMIKDDLAVLGIEHDVFTSEHAVITSGKVDEAVKLLEDKALLYQGVLEPPKGKPVPEDWEAQEQLLFRSTDFGDDCDRPIKKSDGTWAYITPDIAYHLDKYQRGFDQMVLVVGADHAGYQKRLQAAVAALSGGKASLEVRLCQMVKFMRGGEPLKMSKRAGTFVTVREVVDEVGKDVFRFIMLTRSSDQTLDFDFNKVMEQTRENPVFYVQYAYARAHSILRMAQSEMPDAFAEAQLPTAALTAHLTAMEEIALLRIIALWPRIVEQAARAGEPHRVAYYLHDLASAFHSLWNKGNDNNTLRFIQKDAIEVTAARVALARALATTIASALAVLGVEPMEELR